MPRPRYFETWVCFPGAHVPVRTVLFELDSGSRILLSPGSQLTRAQLDGMGGVTDLVAPSGIHTGGMRAAHEAHPSARLWGPSPAQKKQATLPWDGTLGVDRWPHDAELQLITIGGVPRLGESAFLHRVTRTLYLNDLVFNVLEPRGSLAWLVGRLYGNHRRFAVSRLFMAAVQDRVALRRSCEALLSLDFDTVVPSHGAPVTSGARDCLHAAFRERQLA